MRARAIGGFVLGAILLASAVAHACMGWPAVSGMLKESRVAPDLIATLGMGWIFGSVSMLVFAATVFHLSSRLWRDPSTSLFPMLLIGLGYLAFGGGAITQFGWRGHPMGFALIGLLLLLLGWKWSQPETSGG